MPWTGCFAVGFFLYYLTRPVVEQRYSVAIRQVPHVLIAPRDKGLADADVILTHPMSSRSIEFRKYPDGTTRYGVRINAVLRVYWTTLLSGHFRNDALPQLMLQAEEMLRQRGEG